MLDVDKMANMPIKIQSLIEKIKSYDFYVMYGLGYNCMFLYNGYLSWFGRPRYIIDKSKGGISYCDVPVLSSVKEVKKEDKERFCVIVTAISYADEIVKECLQDISENDIIINSNEIAMNEKRYRQFLLNNKNKIVEFYDNLADEKSKNIFEKWLIGRATIDVNMFEEICTPNAYMSFCSEMVQKAMGYSRIYPVAKNRQIPYTELFETKLFDIESCNVLYDVGAAHGDTIAGFFESRSTAGRCVAVEIDPKIVKETQLFCDMNNYEANVICCGVADREGTFEMNSGNLGGGSIEAQMVSKKKGDSCEVRITTIDNLVKETGCVPKLIKMDIEGAELKVLRGAKKTIIDHHPVLIICIYHKPEDIIEIPQYICSLYPEYKLYVRHFSITTSEQVLFAIPEGK